MRRVLRWCIQLTCLPSVPLMAVYAWAAEDGLTIGRSFRFAWDWWLGFWEVL